MDLSVSDVKQWGALALFALAVWRMLERQSPLLKQISEGQIAITTTLGTITPLLATTAETLVTVQVTLASLLERERVRHERMAAAQAAAAAAGPPKQRARTNPYGQPVTPPPPAAWDDDEPTPITTVPLMSGAYGPKRRGTSGEGG